MFDGLALAFWLRTQLTKSKLVRCVQEQTQRPGDRAGTTRTHAFTGMRLPSIVLEHPVQVVQYLFQSLKRPENIMTSPMHI
jgi:hypothetical protein